MIEWLIFITLLPIAAITWLGGILLGISMLVYAIGSAFGKRW